MSALQTSTGIGLASEEGEDTWTYMLCLPKQPKGLEAEIEQNIVRDLSMVLYTPLQAST